ncbi:hypothetical protein Pint_27974 [Pistacia integerrima]|uniref:Uncharacterized protein n=1 Tax=Pistacia integerrima TaxID=434235 RepID=A0ACC0YPK5_9ROSI|nr:hypothetical protein Pint_27974 [Pistacia integerrima]
MVQILEEKVSLRECLLEQSRNRVRVLVKETSSRTQEVLMHVLINWYSASASSPRDGYQLVAVGMHCGMEYTPVIIYK